MQIMAHFRTCLHNTGHKLRNQAQYAKPERPAFYRILWFRQLHALVRRGLVLRHQREALGTNAVDTWIVQPVDGFASHVNLITLRRGPVSVLQTRLQ